MSEPIIGRTAPNSGQNSRSRIVLGGILANIRQHRNPSLTPTLDGAPPQPDASTIKIVTPITCHQSRITGESTCSMRRSIPSENRLIHSTSLTTSMIWLMFVNLAPRSHTPTRVTLRQVQIRKIQQELQGFRQEWVREGLASGARNEAVYKRARCWSAHLFVLRQRATPSPFCMAPCQTATVGSFWRRVVVLLVACFLLLSNNKGFLWLFVRCESISNLARFKTASRPAGRPSRFRKRKILDNLEA
jgi:hypothetical protein